MAISDRPEITSERHRAAIRDLIVRSLVIQGYPNPTLHRVTKQSLRHPTAPGKKAVRIENPQRDRLFDEAA